MIAHRAARRSLLLVVSMLLGSCVDAPRVFQGAVVSHDPAAQELVVKDEQPPGATRRFSVEGAEIGAAPTAGDVVRIAYREAAGRLRATRVANLTRQGEIRQKK
jgi:hypothetical protein